MKAILSCLALAWSLSAQAQTLIDNFGANQIADTEIGSVTAALGGVRHLSNPSDSFGFTTAEVSNGSFRCFQTSGAGDQNVFSCTATYDGNKDGMPDLATGSLGTGVPGGGIDLATGAIGIEFDIGLFAGAGQVFFRARNYDGTQCALQSDFLTGTGPVLLPYNVEGCLDANGQLPTDVRGVSIRTLVGFDLNATVAINRVRVVPIPTYTVGGTVSGLAPGSTVTLQNNGGDDLVIDAKGDFTFTTEIPDQSSYDVTVAMQPANPLQLCTVNDGAGQVDGGSVITVDVQCAPAFSIGGTVSGLQNPGLVLDLNGESMLLFEQDAPYTFPLGVVEGGDYDVTTALVPVGHDCQISGGSDVIGGADITDANVTCTTDILFSDGLETLSVDPIALD